MRIALVIACLTTLAPAPAAAQQLERPPAGTLRAAEWDLRNAPPARPLGQRYLEALAGSATVTGILVAGVSVLTAAGLGISYAANDDIAFYSVAYAAMALGPLAFIAGPAAGTRYWTGISGGEAVLVALLGVLMDAITFGVSVGFGIAAIATGVVDEVEGAYAMYLVGAAAGVLSGFFLQPLFGAAIFGDRRPEGRSEVAVAPVFAATERGGVLGLTGAF